MERAIKVQLVRSGQGRLLKEVQMNYTGIGHFRVTDYFDVWGNPSDGFEVNNWSFSYFRAPVSILNTRRSCLKALKKIGFIKKSAREDSFSWEDTDDGYILSDRRGCPVCRIEELSQGEFEFYVRDSEIPNWELV